MDIRPDIQAHLGALVLENITLRAHVRALEAQLQGQADASGNGEPSPGLRTHMEQASAENTMG